MCHIAKGVLVLLTAVGGLAASVRRFLWAGAWACVLGIALGAADAAAIDSRWLGGTDLWSNPAQWTPFQPGCFPGGCSGEYNVTVDAGTATLDRRVRINELTLSGGTIGGPFDVIVDGPFTWSGGTFTGAAETTVRSSMTINGPAFLGGDRLLFMEKLAMATQQGGDLFFDPGGGTLRITYESTYSLLDDSGMYSNGGMGTLINYGTFQKIGGTGISIIEATLLRSDTVNVSSGTLRFAGDVSEVFQANTLERFHTWNVLNGSALEFSQASAGGGNVIATNLARVVLSGASAKIADASGNDIMQGFLAYNGGPLVVQDGANFVTAATRFTNVGSVTVGPDTTFTVGGSNDYANGGGRTTLTSSTSTLAVAPGHSFLNEASSRTTLEGFGTIQGNLVNSGLVRPGLAGQPGVLTITGDYAEVEAGASGPALSIQLGGPSAGVEFSQLAVLGTSFLEGTIDVALIDDFTPSLDEEFMILTAAGVSGGFINNFIQEGGFTFEVLYEPTQVVLHTTAIPEPGTMLLLGSGLAAMAVGRRRNHRE